MTDTTAESLKILSTFDDDYAECYATMLTSVCESTALHSRLEVLLVANFLGPAIRSRLERFVARLPNSQLRWLHLDTTPIAAAPISMHFRLAAYGRILAFEAVADLSRLIYLDCDLICLDNLRHLWDQPLEGCVLGAVVDPGATFCFDGHTEDLGLKPGAVHFNSGVLVVDLEQWRRERLTDRCLRFLNEKRSVVRWADQDVLNAVVPSWQKLPACWNAQTHFYKSVYTPLLEQFFPEDLAEVRAPKIVHFNDPFKPWHRGYEHPLAHVYQHFCARSQWNAVA
jgi:lipopolysaccharide biosynthesis glycosyltransferase